MKKGILRKETVTQHNILECESSRRGLDVLALGGKEGIIDPNNQRNKI